MTQPINVVALVGPETIYQSYMLVRQVYGPDFDARMADLSIQVEGLREESTKPGGITFNESAFLLLIQPPDDDFSKEKNEALSHELRAVMLWNELEKPFVAGEIENLKKVLGDVRGG